MAKVDIVIPCYNYGRFLKPCVDSVLSQSISDMRVMIIDDSSSDNSRAVAESLAMADRRVSVISHANNIGHIRTYNEGIEWLDSDYFMLLSADDLLVPGSLERACRVMDDNSDVVLTHGKGIEWYDGTPFPTEINSGDGSWSRHDLLREMCANAANGVVTPTAIVRTSTQKSIGCYEIDLPHSADMAMWLKFAAKGSVAHINTVQAIYRRHSTNMSASYYAGKLADYKQRKAAFDNFFRTKSNLPSDAARLQRLAYRKLAEQAYWTCVGQLMRGKASNARALLQFATDINPHLYYLPPFQQLFRTPRLGNVLSSIASEAAARHLGRSSDRN
jgi:glycosyltransferase involved in cell wall biosynthesis